MGRVAVTAVAGPALPVLDEWTVAGSAPQMLSVEIHVRVIWASHELRRTCHINGPNQVSCDNFEAGIASPFFVLDGRFVAAPMTQIFDGKTRVGSGRESKWLTLGT